MGGTVGNLFRIFFQHPRVKFALFLDAICNNWAQEKGGNKAIKLNISQRICVFLGVILTSEGTQRSTIRNKALQKDLYQKRARPRPYLCYNP